MPRECKGCKGPHDEFAFHPGVCKAGNRHGLWTQRHDAFQMSLHAALQRLGAHVVSCSSGSGNWFGTAGCRPDGKGYKRADIVGVNKYAVGRHLFIDTAIADPNAGAARSAVPSAAEAAGVAAELRASKKVAKYAPLAGAVSSHFMAAVVERYGACCDSFVGLLKLYTGDGERDPTVCDDWTTFATSSTTYLASRVVFTAVVADACMVERVLSIDVAGAAMASAMPAHARAYARPAGPRCAFERPSASVVEGRGGIMWYESM